MAAVAAEPGAAAVHRATITDEAPSESGPAETGRPRAPPEPDGTAPEPSACQPEDDGEAEERRHVRPELEPAAGTARCEDDPDRLCPGAPGDSEGLERLSAGVQGDPVSVPEPSPSSAVFLLSFPAPPPPTEAGLSLDEPAEPSTSDRADTWESTRDTSRDRGYTARGPPEDSELVYSRPSAGSEEPRGRSPPCRPPGEERSRPELGAGPGAGSGSPQDPLSPGSEVRVCLDHVIDDALVVSFRRGEKVFSGVLMDISKRFGPYGIPITVFPRRDDRSSPQMSVQLPLVKNVDPSTKQEELSVSPASSPHPHPWTSKPPPLFQEGAPYPPPLFIRDTYNQALPQPLPRKIKRPKRRYRCEEPTSIMNAIKLRPRQVLCDKCKGVVASAGHRESRRGTVDLRSEEVSRRRRPAEGPISSEVKRLRSDDKGVRPATDRRSSSGIRVSSSSSSSRRVLRGVATSSPAPSSRMCLNLNSKKVLAKGSTVDRSKARQVLKKLARNSQPQPPPPPHRRPKDQNQNQGENQDRTKAVTRAAALQNHNQKVHFTRRLQHLSSAAVSSTSHTVLPPRMRLKPQSTSLKSC